MQPRCGAPLQPRRRCITFPSTMKMPVISEQAGSQLWLRRFAQAVQQGGHARRWPRCGGGRCCRGPPRRRPAARTGPAPASAGSWPAATACGGTGRVATHTKRRGASWRTSHQLTVLNNVASSQEHGCWEAWFLILNMTSSCKDRSAPSKVSLTETQLEGIEMRTRGWRCPGRGRRRRAARRWAAGTPCAWWGAGTAGTARTAAPPAPRPAPVVQCRSTGSGHLAAKDAIGPAGWQTKHSKVHKWHVVSPAEEQHTLAHPPRCRVRTHPQPPFHGSTSNSSSAPRRRARQSGTAAAAPPSGRRGCRCRACCAAAPPPPPAPPPRSRPTHFDTCCCTPRRPPPPAPLQRQRGPSA